MTINVRQHQASLLATRAIQDSIVTAVPVILIFIASVAVVPNFLSPSNVTNVLNNASLLAIVGFGMTYAIAIRGIDLSVGSTQALLATITGLSVNAFGPFAGIAIALACGIAIGLLNGTMVSYLRIPAFVATLATMTGLRGVALLITDGSSVYIRDDVFNSISSTSVLGIETQTYMAVLLGIVAWIVLNKTSFGKHVIAVGGRPEAAAEIGIKTRQLNLVVYVIAGAVVSVAAILTASRIGVVNGTLNQGLELQVIAIVVLGGTSLAGGKANILGTGLAAILLAMINSALNLLNVPSYWQYVAVGLLLVIALGIDGVRRIRARRRRSGLDGVGVA